MRCCFGRVQELSDRMGSGDTRQKRQGSGFHRGRICQLTTAPSAEGFTSFHPAFICTFLLSLALLSSPLYLAQSDYSALCKL